MILGLSLLIVITACSNDSRIGEGEDSLNNKTLKNSNEFEFDYRTYEAYMDVNLDVEIPDSILDKPDNAEKYEKIAEYVGNKFKMNISLNELDELYIDNIDNSEYDKEYYSNLYLNETDKHLLELFKKDLIEEGFSVAIENFQEEVLNHNLSEDEFYKYNTFVNIAMLLEEQDSHLYYYDYSLREDDTGPGSIVMGDDDCERATAEYCISNFRFSFLCCRWPCSTYFLWSSHTS